MDALDEVAKATDNLVTRRGALIKAVGYALPFVIVGTVALAVVGAMSLL